MVGRTHWVGLMVGFGATLGLLGAPEVERQNAQITGRITDLSGELPLPGVTVTLRRAGDPSVLEPGLRQSPIGEIAYQTTTTEDGSFAFESVAPRSNYLLLASSPGWRTGLIRDIYPNDGAILFFDLGLPLARISPSAGFVITGRIVGQDGSGVGDASILVSAALDPGITYRTRSGADGRFEIRVFERATFVVFVLKPGKGAGVATWSIFPEAVPEPLIIQLGSGQ